VDAATGLEQTTNDFRFTWCQEQGTSMGRKEPRKVVFKTYQGTRASLMVWIFEIPDVM
jgi:acyl-coenzyme A thioesterase 9